MQLLLQVLNKEPKTELPAAGIKVDVATPEGEDVAFADLIALAGKDEAPEAKFPAIDVPLAREGAKVLQVDVPDTIEVTLSKEPLPVIDANGDVPSPIPALSIGTTTPVENPTQPVAQISRPVPKAAIQVPEQPQSPEKPSENAGKLADDRVVKAPEAPVQPATPQAPIAVDRAVDQALPLRPVVSQSPGQHQPKTITETPSDRVRIPATPDAPVKVEVSADRPPNPEIRQIARPDTSAAPIDGRPAIPQAQPSARVDQRPLLVPDSRQFEKPEGEAPLPRAAREMPVIPQAPSVTPTQVPAAQAVPSVKTAPPKAPRAPQAEAAPEVVVSVPAANGPKEAPDVAQTMQQVTFLTKTPIGKDAPFTRDFALVSDDGLPPLAGSDGTEPRRVLETQAPRSEPAARPVLTQLVQAAKSAIDGMVEVRLSPEELGRVRLAMTTVESGMTVLVTAERAETLDLIRRNIELFAADLEQQGFTDLNFAFGGETAQGDDDKPHNSSGQPDDISPGLRRVITASTHATGISADGRVDIRL